MSVIPDPGLTMEEALTLTGVAQFAAGFENRYRSDAVLAEGLRKLHASAHEHQRQHPGSLEEVQQRLAIKRQLDQTD